MKFAFKTLGLFASAACQAVQYGAQPYAQASYQPAYNSQQNIYTQPNYQVNSYAQPNYQDSIYAQPNYQVNSYAQPNYQDSSYAQPNYQVNSNTYQGYQVNYPGYGKVYDNSVVKDANFYNSIYFRDDPIPSLSGCPVDHQMMQQVTPYFQPQGPQYMPYNGYNSYQPNQYGYVQFYYPYDVEQLLPLYEGYYPHYSLASYQATKDYANYQSASYAHYATQYNDANQRIIVAPSQYQQPTNYNNYNSQYQMPAQQYQQPAQNYNNQYQQPAQNYNNQYQQPAQNYNNQYQQPAQNNYNNQYQQPAQNYNNQYSSQYTYPN